MSEPEYPSRFTQEEIDRRVELAMKNAKAIALRNFGPFCKDPAAAAFAQLERYVQDSPPPNEHKPGAAPYLRLVKR